MLKVVKKEKQAMEIIKDAGILIAVVVVTGFLLGMAFSAVERKECRDWAENPAEIRHAWQYDQCEYHDIPLSTT